MELLVAGGQRLGFGHVGRCLALWEELEGRAVFCAEDADLVRTLSSLGVPVTTRRAPAGTGAPVVLVDRATPTGAEEVASLQAGGQRVCLLDDPGSGRLHAELVVDPPTGASWPPTGGRRLGGFEHALLRRDIRAARTPAPPPVPDATGRANASGPDERAGVDVLLSLGGSDPEGLTPALAQALNAAGLSVLSVLGPAYAGPRPHGASLEDPRAWPRELARARLLVGRFGHTLLEAAHLGTPALALAFDERSAHDAQAFATYGTCVALRLDGPKDRARVVAAALALCGDEQRLRDLSARGRELVDGLGAVRVARALCELAGGAR